MTTPSGSATKPAHPDPDATKVVESVDDEPAATLPADDEQTQGESPDADGDRTSLPGATAPARSSVPDESAGRASAARRRGTTITSAAEALEDEERTRMRLLGLSGFAVNALAALVLPLFGGDALAKVVFLLGLAIHALTNFGLFYVAGRDRLFTERWLMLLWCGSFVGLHLVIYYFGVLSVASVALVLGLYIVGTTRFERVAWASFVFVSAGAALSVILQTVGVLPDLGRVPITTVGTMQRFAMLGLLEAMFVAVHLIGRGARRNLEATLEQLSTATRAVAQREALLEEARAEFRRAQRVGGPGRFTNARVGRFELGLVLGRGGMGEIYEAVDVDTGDPAAVKVLTREAIHRENMLERFFRECEIVARLHSPYVVEVLATGGPPEEVPYIAMERLVGRDLASHAGELRTLPVAEVIRIVREVGAGLEAAADAGVVHRDVKPHNIFRLHEEHAGVRYKILDFGVSKLSASGGTLTAGEAIGTPGYMAPEQARGGRVDHLTDLYALGAVAYRCLVGQAPFRGRDAAQILVDVVQKMPTRPCSMVALHPDFDAVFAIMLAKRPGDRFHRVREVVEALEAASRGELPHGVRDRARHLLAALPWSEPRLPETEHAG